MPRWWQATLSSQGDRNPSSLSSSSGKRDGLTEANSSSSPAVARQGLRGVAVLDFDCTLTSFHVFARFTHAPLPNIPIDANTFVDLEALRWFVGAARKSHADVAVATFGRRDVVDKALTFALGSNHGVVISTPADHYDPRFEFADEDDRPRCDEGSQTLGDKNTQLKELSRRFNLTNLILLDDDRHNVDAANKNGFVARHAPQGATRPVLEAMLEALLASAPK